MTPNPWIRLDNVKSGLWILVLALIGTAVYYQSLTVPFHFDDRMVIVENPAIKDLAIARIWRLDPSRFLTHLSFAINYKYNYLNVAGYHVVNIALHVINAFLVYLLIRIVVERLSNKREESSWRGVIPYLTSLLFLVHPIQTQAVTYISQRSILLASFSYLLTLILYIHYRQCNKGVYYFLSLLTYSCGLFTKPMIVTLPLTIILCEFFLVDRGTEKVKSFIFRWLPYCLLAGIVPILLVLWKHKVFDVTMYLEMTRETGTLSRLEYLFTQFNVIWIYLGLLIFPARQNLDYDFPIAHSILEFPTILSCLGLVFLLYIAWRIHKKQPIVFFGLMWFFMTISLESSVFPIADVINEHRCYMPMIGVTLIVTYLIGAATRHWRVCCCVAAVVVVSLSAATYQRNLLWQDEVTFLSDVADQSPQKARVFTNLGFAYIKQGDMNQAQVNFEKAVFLNPNAKHALNNLGNIYFERSEYEQAIEYFQRAIQVDSHFAGGYYNTGNCYFKMGDVDRAESYYTEALKINAEFVPAMVGIGTISRLQGHDDKAEFYLQSAIHFDSGNPDAYMELGHLYIKRGRYAPALAQFQEAAKIRPTAAVLNSMGNAYDMLMREESAIDSYQRAIELDPYFADAYFNLGNILFKMGKRSDAARHYGMAYEMYEKRGNQKMVRRTEERLEAMR